MDIRITALSAAAALLAGCGHSITTYSKGVGFETTWRTDEILPSVRIGTYENVDMANKENSHVRYSSGTNAIGTIASLFGGKPGMGSGTSLEVRTGPITTGYVRDVLTSPEVTPDHVRIARAMCGVDAGLADRETTVQGGSVESNQTPSVRTRKTALGTVTTEIPVDESTAEAVMQATEQPRGIADGIADMGVAAAIAIGVFVFAVGAALTALILSFRRRP